MSHTVSPSSTQPYGVARVTLVWNLARSSFYAARQRSDAKVFKKYSQMKLQMKREALTKLNRQASESGAVKSSDTEAAA